MNFWAGVRCVTGKNSLDFDGEPADATLRSGYGWLGGGFCAA